MLFHDAGNTDSGLCLQGSPPLTEQAPGGLLELPASFTGTHLDAVMKTADEVCWADLSLENLKPIEKKIFNVDLCSSLVTDGTQLLHKAEYLDAVRRLSLI